MAKTVKPTIMEKLLVKKRLRTKYPQMYKPGWGKSKKPLTTTRTKDITAQLKRSGLSDSDIAKLRGKKKK